MQINVNTRKAVKSMLYHRCRLSERQHSYFGKIQSTRHGDYEMQRAKLNSHVCSRGQNSNLHGTSMQTKLFPSTLKLQCCVQFCLYLCCIMNAQRLHGIVYQYIRAKCSSRNCATPATTSRVPCSAAVQPWLGSLALSHLLLQG